MGNIIIGKHVLESLTTGMYADPFVVFREYIQNAADSIDEAVADGIISQENSKIEVIISPNERRITIKDNGTGIGRGEAERTLISVGNSKKSQSASRGFRGIGRLAALSYCGKLIFETSFIGEKNSTRITIDAKKLSERLSLQEREDVSAEEVLEGVYSVEYFQEHEREHYLNVIMESIDPESELNDHHKIHEYLIQNIPVTYDAEKFTWGNEIKRRLKNEGYLIQEYNIYLTYAGKTTAIYKPYTDGFSIDKKGNVTDKIKDIQIVKLLNAEGDFSAFGWIATTNYLGSIYDKNIKGIRIRKGNILIGDNQTLNVCFKDARFNGWAIGEIFIVDSQLVPNARRDNFEKNAAYFLLIEQIKSLAANLVKDIRSASIARNNELAKVINKSQEVKEEITEALESDVLLPSKKGVLRKRLESTKAALDLFSSDDDLDIYNKKIAFDEIDMLIGKLQGATAYKALNALQNVSKAEKKTLEKVFNTIVSIRPEDAEEIIDSILKVFAANKK